MKNNTCGQTGRIQQDKNDQGNDGSVIKRTVLSELLREAFIFFTDGVYRCQSGNHYFLGGQTCDQGKIDSPVESQRFENRIEKLIL